MSIHLMLLASSTGFHSVSDSLRSFIVTSNLPRATFAIDLSDSIFSDNQITSPWTLCVNRVITAFPEPE